VEDAYFRMVACDEHALGEVARILNAGGVAVIPTDTVYGLAAHPAFPQAVDRLYTIKGREAKKPIALLAADAKSVTDAGFALSGRAAKLARDFWPGALTMVLARDPSAQGGAFAQTEGFRVPAHGWTRRLITACGGVLRVTSANLSGAKAATDAKAALEEFGRITAAGIYSIQSVLDLERYAIGGGISARPEVTDIIREKVEAVFTQFPGVPFLKPEIVTCRYGNDANLIGALKFHLDRIH